MDSSITENVGGRYQRSFVLSKRDRKGVCVFICVCCPPIKNHSNLYSAPSKMSVLLTRPMEVRFPWSATVQATSSSRPLANRAVF